MITTNGVWKGFAVAREVEPSRPRSYDADMQPAALGLNNTLDARQQNKSATSIAGSRIQGWPQFFVLWQIIGCVSAFDAYLAMKYRDELFEEERNPLGQLLLILNQGDPALFLGVKFMGTMMVLGILVNIYHSRPQWGLAIAKGVAAYQLSLLAYLTLACPRW